MKNILYRLLFTITLIITLGCVNVHARTSANNLGTCNYNFNYKNDNIEFKIILYKNKIEKSINSDGQYSKTGNAYWHYKDSFDDTFFKQVVNSDKSLNPCPSLTICYIPDSMINIYNNSARACAEEEQRTSAIGNLTINTGTNVKEDNVFCTKESPVKFKNYNISVRFYEDASGNKKFQITNTSDNSTASANANGIVSLDGITYSLEQGVINKLYSSSDSCKKTAVYLRHISNGGNDHSITITLTKPTNGDNAAYAPNDEYIDQGMTDPDAYYGKTDNVNLTGVAACALVGQNSELGKQIKQIIWIVRIAIPVLIIILSIVDFLKVFMIDEDKVYKQSWTRLLKRCIAGIAFFLIPSILKLLFIITDVLNIYSISPDSIFCYLI